MTSNRDPLERRAASPSAPAAELSRQCATCALESVLARRASPGAGGLRLLLALTLALGACGGPAAPPAFERPPAQVTVAVAESADVPLYLDEIGRCAAREMVAIQPQVSGRITALHFVDGAELAVGDALFTIDPRPYQARVESAEAAVAESKAALELARLEYERVARLVETKAVSRSDYDLRKNARDIADARVQSAEAALASAKLDLEYCDIRSPIQGLAGQHQVDLGAVVTANEGTLLVIQRVDPIYADFTIAQDQLGDVQREMARGALRVEVRLPDDAEARAGELTFLDNAVQEGTGTVKLRATLANVDRHFWPGRFVRVRLVLDTLAGAVLVPTAATQTSATGPYVYVAKPDSTAELRPVQLGQRQGERVVVKKGLAAGEQVVVTGQLAVMPGGKVHVVESAVAQHAPGSAPAVASTPASSGATASGARQ